MKKISRKSLIYNNNLLKNHILSENDISLIRPGTGILGNNFKYFVGKKLKKKVKKFEQIKFAHVKK